MKIRNVTKNQNDCHVIAFLSHPVKGRYKAIVSAFCILLSLIGLGDNYGENRCTVLLCYPTRVCWLFRQSPEKWSVLYAMRGMLLFSTWTAAEIYNGAVVRTVKNTIPRYIH